MLWWVEGQQWCARTRARATLCSACVLRVGPPLSCARILFAATMSWSSGLFSIFDDLAICAYCVRSVHDMLRHAVGWHELSCVCACASPCAQCVYRLLVRTTLRVCMREHSGVDSLGFDGRNWHVLISVCDVCRLVFAVVFSGALPVLAANNQVLVNDGAAGCGLNAQSVRTSSV